METLSDQEMTEPRLPLINRERTLYSIRLWNADVSQRQALEPRQRKEAWRRLKNAAKKFDLQIDIEK
jgi:hypothetical protein